MEEIEEDCFGEDGIMTPIETVNQIVGYLFKHWCADFNDIDKAVEKYTGFKNFMDEINKLDK